MQNLKVLFKKYWRKKWVVFLIFIGGCLGVIALLRNFLNFIFGAPLWTGISAIATASMVYLTYSSLRAMKKEREAQINRETIEKIYSVLLKDLETILTLRKIENLESIYSSNWKWEEIKSHEQWLSYQIPEDLFQKLNELSEKVKDYEKLKDTFKEKFKNLLTEIVKSKEILPKEILDKVEQVEAITYWEGEGLDYKGVSIFDLFFWNKNLHEFLNETELKGKFLLDYFTSQGRQRKELNEEKFNEILNVVNNKKYIFNRHYLPKEDFHKLTVLHKEIKSLKKEIENVVSKLARSKI